MDKEFRPCLSQKHKQDITDIFHSILKQLLNKLSRITTSDIILNGIQVINTKTELKTKNELFL